MAKAKQAASWIVQEAQRLGAKTLAYPECGHATRTLMSYFPGWFGDGIRSRSCITWMISSWYLSRISCAKCRRCSGA
jgi:hypothetical protein